MLQTQLQMKIESIAMNITLRQRETRQRVVITTNIISPSYVRNELEIDCSAHALNVINNIDKK